MMKVFLTSQPFGEYMAFETDYPGMNPANDFAANLRRAWIPDARVLLIASEPDNHEMADGIAAGLKEHILGEGLSMKSMTVCDHRTDRTACASLSEFDVIFLSGGHVPTTNDYYREIALAEKLLGFNGVLIGISSGTMNSAAEVYAQPEMPGESAPEFRRFRKGLGLVDLSVIPHYEVMYDQMIDGKRLFEDVTYPDSVGKRFYVFVDGTYLTEEIDWKDWKLENGQLRPEKEIPVTLYGKAFLLQDGVLRNITGEGEKQVLSKADFS